MKIQSKLDTTQTQTQLALFQEPNSRVLIPGPRYQYLYVISPPDHVKGRVRKIWSDLNRVSDLGNQNRHTIPNISIGTMLVNQPIDKKFGREAQLFFQNLKPFIIKLKNFSYFKHGTQSRSIYIGVENSESLMHVYENFSLLIGAPPRSILPHVSIARTISTDAFQKVYPMIEGCFFEDHFLCDRITILERTIYKGTAGRYREVDEIRFWGDNT